MRVPWCAAASRGVRGPRPACFPSCTLGVLWMRRGQAERGLHIPTPFMASQQPSGAAHTWHPYMASNGYKHTYTAHELGGSGRFDRVFYLMGMRRGRVERGGSTVGESQSVQTPSAQGGAREVREGEVGAQGGGGAVLTCDPCSPR
jgi:hypothetical protein